MIFHPPPFGFLLHLFSFTGSLSASKGLYSPHSVNTTRSMLFRLPNAFSNIVERYYRLKNFLIQYRTTYHRSVRSVAIRNGIDHPAMNIHLRVQALVEVSSNRRCETTFCGKVIDSIILNIEFDDKFQSIIQPQSEKLFSYHTEDSGKRTIVGDNRKRLQFGRLEANFPLLPL